MHTWTTLRELRDAQACEERYSHLVAALGNAYRDDTPIDLLTILRHNGIDDVLWIPRRIVHGDHIDMRYRLFAVACAQDVLRLMRDQRSRDAVRVAHLHAYGEAADAELSAAREAAWEAAAREAARAAAWAAARAAAREAVGATAARAAAWEAAREAAWEAARAAAREAVGATAREAAWEAAREAARVRQVEWFEAVFSADMEE